MYRHVEVHHKRLAEDYGMANDTHHCWICDLPFARSDHLLRHNQVQHPEMYLA